MKKRMTGILVFSLLAAMLTACGTKKESGIRYHFADREEAVSCYLGNEEYFKGYSPCDIQYRTQDSNGTLEEVKEFGASQMQEFTDEDKECLKKVLEEMEADLKDHGYRLPDLEEITFIKSSQKEECGSAAYTHETQIYLGQYMVDFLSSEDEEERLFGKSILWHEIFHCLTRKNPDFRKDMYQIIHFTVQDEEYQIPPELFKQYISNPDVPHHNSYATFKIHGKNVDCFTVLIAEKPFEKEGDSFFDSMKTALVATDGSNACYKMEDTDNFWEVFGRNTEYVIDPEECMADNFGFTLTYGADGMEYKNPEIIKAIQDYLSADH